MTERDWIQSVVELFYARARTDILIAYHFRNITDFDAHIPRIAAFWDLQLLGTTERELSHPFDVMQAHVPLGIKRGELGRWLLLFRGTLSEQTKAHPQMQTLSEAWDRKLTFFEGNFLRFFGL